MRGARHGIEVSLLSLSLIAAGVTAPCLMPATAHAQQAKETVAPKPAKPRAAAKQQAPADDTQQTADAAPSPAPSRSSGSGQAIIVLVNDEPITAYEVELRQQFLGLSASGIGERAQVAMKQLAKSEATAARWQEIQKKVIEGNRGKSRDEIIAILKERQKDLGKSLQQQALASARASVLPGLKKKALEELIEERLKLQEAKRLNTIVSDDEVTKVLAGIAERNKMTVEQFGQHLKGMGANLETMRSRFKATLSWNDVIRRRFGAMIAVSDRDIDRLVTATAGDEAKDLVELQVHKITLPVDTSAQQDAVQKMHQAEALRGKFAGCATTKTVAAAVPGAKFEDLGTVKLNTVAEPTRTFLLEAKDGDMLPPSVGPGGVELWAVCGRKAVKADEKKRTAAQDELRQREFEILARRHLKDLKQDAAIEYRVPELR